MARQKVIEEKKKTKADQRPPGAGKAAKTLMMKKNLEAKPKDTVKKAPRHRHGVARAILANQLNKSGKRVFQRRPVVALIRQLAQEIRPETRLSKDFVDRILAVVENEGLEVGSVFRLGRLLFLVWSNGLVSVVGRFGPYLGGQGQTVHHSRLGSLVGSAHLSLGHVRFARRDSCTHDPRPLRGVGALLL